MTRGEQVLRWLKKFPKGKRFTEIQRYVVEEIHGRDWNEREGIAYYDDYLSRRVVTKPGGGPRRYRGYACTLLMGPSSAKGIETGILRKYCEQRKDEHGIVRYVVVKPIKPPFSRWSEDEMKARNPNYKTRAERLEEAKQHHERFMAQVFR
jgi:hypothetical protein